MSKEDLKRIREMNNSKTEPVKMEVEPEIFQSPMPKKLPSELVESIRVFHCVFDDSKEAKAFNRTWNYLTESKKKEATLTEISNMVVKRKYMFSSINHYRKTFEELLELSNNIKSLTPPLPEPVETVKEDVPRPSEGPTVTQLDIFDGEVESAKAYQHQLNQSEDE